MDLLRYIMDSKAKEGFVKRFLDIIKPLFVMTLICMSCLNKNKEYIMIGKRGAKLHNGAEENQIRS
jgi:hypothetical protein